MAHDSSRPHPTPGARLVRPLREFIRTEASGGIVLVAAAVVALVWANSPWSDAYGALFERHFAFDLGAYGLDESLHWWVNDGLMVLFFFIVGLEVKRELVEGELASVRRAALPLAAAAGGMLAPALLFLAFAHGPAERGGWGVPMATDIAFALGVLTLAGPRVPAGLKVLLLALAVFDDLGAVAVIAVFYTDALDLGAVVVAVALLASFATMARLRVGPWPLYLAPAVAAWAAMVESGVHPTIAGVALGLLTPAGVRWSPRGGNAVDSAAERLEHVLHPWVAFGVMPLFALANAGVDLRGGALDEALRSSVTAGVIAGLVLGKPVGIMAATWLARRAGAEWPPGVTWRNVFGMACVAGIGFTVALFIAELAYEDALLAEAKTGVLAASVLSGVLGYGLLRVGRARETGD